MNNKDLLIAQTIIDTLFYVEKALTQWQHRLLEDVISLASIKLRKLDVGRPASAGAVGAAVGNGAAGQSGSGGCRHRWWELASGKVLCDKCGLVKDCRGAAPPRELCLVELPIVHNASSI